MIWSIDTGPSTEPFLRGYWREYSRAPVGARGRHSKPVTVVFREPHAKSTRYSLLARKQSAPQQTCAGLAPCFKMLRERPNSANAPSRKKNITLLSILSPGPRAVNRTHLSVAPKGRTPPALGRGPLTCRSRRSRRGPGENITLL